MPYAPPQHLLERYAELLVGFGLGNGAGIAAGDVVRVVAPEDAKPLFTEVCRAVWRAGGHVLPSFLPADDAEHNLTAAFFELATDAQLDWAPLTYGLAEIEQTDHSVHLLCDRDPRALSDVDPQKLFRQRRARKPILDARLAKEDAGGYTWTAALYGTPGMAAEARLTPEDYWQQIVKGCLLEDPDPIARWREVNERLQRISSWLNGLRIESVHVRGEDADLRLRLGPGRRFVGAAGANIPSFECFTSPDWRGTEGWIRFNQPNYYLGALIEGVELRFEGGRVSAATAAANQPLLEQLVATDAGAAQLGEFSLTDARLSPIDHFMAETLYDENTGGPFGNTHVAVGFALGVCFDGDARELTPERKAELGFNDSAIHVDFVSTSDRTVTATLADGSTRVIYEGGRFALDL